MTTTRVLEFNDGEHVLVSGDTDAIDLIAGILNTYTDTTKQLEKSTAYIVGIKAVANQAVTDLLPIMSYTEGVDGEEIIHAMIQQIADKLMGIVETEQTAVSDDNQTFLEGLKRNLNNQDRRMTSHPVYAVEQRIREFGFDSDYADDYKWINDDDDYAIADETKADALDKEYANVFSYSEKVGDWEKRYYKDHWEFVTACFTEAGCKNYLKINAHNLGKTRIYVHSAWRNNEWITLRHHLSGGEQRE